MYTESELRTEAEAVIRHQWDRIDAVVEELEMRGDGTRFC